MAKSSLSARPVALTIGGSDSCGGAGIQADLRVLQSLGVLGTSAITALTAQNPNTILNITANPLDQFQAELMAISDYYPILAVKTGMLFDLPHVQAVISHARSHLHQQPLIVDPVLISSSGHLLFDAATAKAAYTQLLSIATLWTPNLQEAAFFLNTTLEDIQADPLEAASALLLRYQKPVLLKGGHSTEHLCRDIFLDTNGAMQAFEHPRKSLSSQQAHGTGCRLASAITANLCHTIPLSQAIAKAQHWLQSDL